MGRWTPDCVSFGQVGVARGPAVRDGRSISGSEIAREGVYD